jgi:hypothetical protein
MARCGRRAFLTAVALGAPLSRATPVAQSFSVDEFLVLSSRLTGDRDLDRGLAAALLKGLLATPGVDAARLARPDAALETDIIVAWYTGVHEVRGVATRLTHTGALQWRALDMPAPGVCVGQFGAWARPHRLPEP